MVKISDRCAVGTAEDQTGPRICAEVRGQLGAHIAWTGVVPDEKEQIVDSLRALCLRGLDLVLTCGGTGCGPRDVTPEATGVVIVNTFPPLFV